MGTKLDVENKWDKISRDEIKNKNKSRKWLKNKKKSNQNNEDQNQYKYKLVWHVLFFKGLIWNSRPGEREKIH